MKKKKSFLKSIMFGAMVLFTFSKAISQVPQIDDPQLKPYTYFAFQVSMNYVLPENQYKNAVIEKADFYLTEGVHPSYQPMASLEVGHIFKVAGHPLNINTGVSFASYSLNMYATDNGHNNGSILYKYLNGNVNTELQLTETFLQFPLAISTHFPLTITQASGRYHALELKLGGYYGRNINREIQSNNIFYESLSHNYISLPAQTYSTISFFGEVGLSFTAPNGHSHQIGFRGTYDQGLYIPKDYTYGDIPFLYNSVGVYYRWMFCRI